MATPLALISGLAQQLYQEATRESTVETWLDLPENLRQLWRDMAEVAIAEVRHYDLAAATGEVVAELVTNRRAGPQEPEAPGAFAARERGNERTEARERDHGHE